MPRYAFGLGLALMLGTSCVRQEGVVRSAGAGPRPLVVAIMPFAGDHFDLPSPVRSGCTDGVLSTNVKIVSANGIDAELFSRHLDHVDDRTAAEIAKLFDADAVVVGSVYLGHFSSAV